MQNLSQKSCTVHDVSQKCSFPQSRTRLLVGLHHWVPARQRGIIPKNQHTLRSSTVATATMGTCTSPLKHFWFLTADGEHVQSDSWWLLSASLQMETQQPSVQQTMWTILLPDKARHYCPSWHVSPSHLPHPGALLCGASELCGTAVMMRQNIFRWPKGLCCHLSNLQSSFANLRRKALFLNKVKTFSLCLNFFFSCWHPLCTLIDIIIIGWSVFLINICAKL